MIQRLHDTVCVFRIHLARLRVEAGPFLLAGIVYPSVMYLFAMAVASPEPARVPSQERLRFLAGSIVFSLSMTAISWLGYLLLENRFTGRLKLFATLPVAPSSYILGVVAFAMGQSAVGTTSLIVAARVLGVPVTLDGHGVLLLALVVGLTVLCVSGIAVVIAARARSLSEGSLLTDALGAGIVLIAPVYYPIQALPKVLQALSLALPTTYAARAVNAVLNGRPDVAAQVFPLAVLAVVTLGCGFHVTAWREE